MAEKEIRTAIFEKAVIAAARDYVRELKLPKSSTPIYAVQNRLVAAIEDLDQMSRPTPRLEYPGPHQPYCYLKPCMPWDPDCNCRCHRWSPAAPDTKGASDTV
jgi:hypothetical protein